MGLIAAMIYGRLDPLSPILDEERAPSNLYNHGSDSRMLARRERRKARRRARWIAARAPEPFVVEAYPF